MMHRTRSLLVPLLLLLSFGGCARPGYDTLIVATDLPEQTRAEIGRSFEAWLAKRPRAGTIRSRIMWKQPNPGEEPARLLENGVRVDLVLGGLADSFQRLDAAGRLAGPDGSRSPAWRVFDRPAIGWAANSARLAAAGPASTGDVSALALGPSIGAIAMADPRRDQATFALAQSVLTSDRWPQGYVELIRTFGRVQNVGVQDGSALASLERGEAVVAPALEPNVPEVSGIAFVRSDKSAARGVGLARSAVNPRLGKLFLQFLSETGRATAPSSEEAGPPGAEDLLRDLLGAAFVDAHDELPRALSALDQSKRTDLAEKWLTAPPWPPTSVRKLYRQDPSGALAEELAAQIAPGLDIRIWLLESWNQPERPIDGQLLATLARAVDGKLVAEPRFRAWLRGEWASWARQNYRRIVRQLEKSPS
jgi:hypothetical protein